MRRLLALLLLLAVTPSTLLRDAPRAPDARQLLTVRPLTIPAGTAAMLGPFALAGAWQLDSPHRRFGGYSALLALPGGDLLAFGDGADWLRLSPPDTGPIRFRIGSLAKGRSRAVFEKDLESATRDPATGRIWFGWEGINAISRVDARLNREGVAWPMGVRGWSQNLGAESMARLPGGRFVILAEGNGGNPLQSSQPPLPAALLEGDPLTYGPWRRLEFTGPSGFRPTDMAQLPDGRMLVLMRRLRWPMPPRFAGRIALAADPGRLAPGQPWRAVALANLEEPLPTENFEGLAVVPQADGTLAVWIISDANGALTQRTLLYKLLLDPAKLPKVP